MGSSPQRRLPFLFIFSFLFIVLFAEFQLRLPGLSVRPMHVDEAVHAVKLGELLEHGTYRYDLHDYHGPTLYYATLPYLWLFDIDTFHEIPSPTFLRITSVTFGLLAIFALLLLRGALADRAVLFAALLMAVSPAFVFYSRYYIQEIILILLTLVLMGSFRHWLIAKKTCWLLISGSAIGLMAATKETWFISVGCMAAAGYLIAPDAAMGALAVKTRRRAYIVAVVLAFSLAALLMTNFFANPGALRDMVSAYGSSIARGLTGTIASGPAGIHEHPWWFYLRMLTFYKNAPGPWWSEGFILFLAITGGWFAFRETSRFPRFVAVYAALILFVYSVLSYKTPWLILNILLPQIILAGYAADRIVFGIKLASVRVVVIAIIFGGCLHLDAQSLRAINAFAADPRNPYVYAHTSTTYSRLVQRVWQVRAAPVFVIASGADYWPLPWDLRAHAGVGYWNDIPRNLTEAPVVIAGPTHAEQVRAILGDHYIEEFHGLRPGLVLRLYIRNDVWEKFMASREGTGNAP